MIDVRTPEVILQLKRINSSDDPADILCFLVACMDEGVDVALATLVEIRGGAARTLDAQMAVAADGRYCSYVSGGCVEAAVAAEALLAIAAGRGRPVAFCAGSPFFDIVPPCGGGISIAVHVLRQGNTIKHVLDSLEKRQTAGLRYVREREDLEVMERPERTIWQAGSYTMVYRPRTWIIISGQPLETLAVARFAGFQFRRDRPRPGRYIGEHIDPHSAVLFLHHDLDQEVSVLHATLSSPAFYIGALGSTCTHRRRVERLKALGHDGKDLERINAPTGIFGRARDSHSLALSILDDVAASRLAIYG
ncbi:XdhC family protein [Phyllobacterium sp. 22229]|uniref:XdhC family protein n=1 Tax=Agrobacterium radiobacter TaxID=362 RepID=A0ABD5LKZ6_AGRRD